MAAAGCGCRQRPCPVAAAGHAGRGAAGVAADPARHPVRPWIPHHDGHPSPQGGGAGRGRAARRRSRRSPGGCSRPGSARSASCSGGRTPGPRRPSRSRQRQPVERSPAARLQVPSMPNRRGGRWSPLAAPGATVPRRWLTPPPPLAPTIRPDRQQLLPGPGDPAARRPTPTQPFPAGGLLLSLLGLTLAVNLAMCVGQGLASAVTA
jgi:hypothetical protein